MLILNKRVCESLRIKGHISVVVVGIQANKVQLGLKIPPTADANSSLPEYDTTNTLILTKRIRETLHITRDCSLTVLGITDNHVYLSIKNA